MSFDPKPHLMNLNKDPKGAPRLYLPVAWRLVWFREDHPDWRILTSPLDMSIEHGYAIFQATVMNAEGTIIGMGTKRETAKGFADFVEKAETGAIGRALALCGYGTQFEPELNEGDSLADAPQEKPQKNDPICSKCQQAIKSTLLGNRLYTPQELSEKTDGLCYPCFKTTPQQQAGPRNGNGSKRKAADPVMAKLCILCDEWFQPTETTTAEQMMRAWFAAEYGVEHRTELTAEQKWEAIERLTELVEKHRGGVK